MVPQSTHNRKNVQSHLVKFILLQNKTVNTTQKDATIDFGRPVAAERGSYSLKTIATVTIL